MAVVVAVVAWTGGARGALMAPTKASDLDPQAQSALAFLPEYLGSTLEPEGPAPRLYIVGDTHWLGDLLRRFPPVATVTMLSADTAFLVVPDASSLVLHVGRNRSEMSRSMHMALPLHLRRVLWLSPSSSDLPHFWISARHDLAWMKVQVSRVAVAWPNGTTQIYRRQGESVTFLDDWTAERGWRRGVPLFYPSCSRWRPNRNGTLTAWIKEDEGRDPFLLHAFQATRDILKEVTKYQKLRFEVRYFSNYWQRDMSVATRECTMGLREIFVLNPFIHQGFDLFPWDHVVMVGMVPSGLGPQRSPWGRITDEFGPRMWCVTVMATVTVATVMYCLSHHRDGVLAAIQALAPLLSQASPTRIAMWQRPLHSSWMAVCIVLVTAYQSQLLSDISSARFSNIDSLPELAASDLVVYFKDPSHANTLPLEEWGLLDKVRYTGPADMDTLLGRVTKERRAAVLAPRDTLDYVPLKYRHSLHAFQVGHCLARALEQCKILTVNLPPQN